MSEGNYLFQGPNHIVPPGIMARRQELIQYLGKDPSFLNGWLEVSILSQYLHDKEYAMHAAKMALEIDPSNISSLERMGQNPAGTSAGQIASLFWYEKILAQEPENLSALNWHFQNALVCQNYSEALDYAKTLARIEPHSPAAHARLGRVLSIMNEKMESSNSYARASQLCNTSDFHFPNCRDSYIKPLYTALSGDLDSSERESEAICLFKSISFADFDNPRYPTRWFNKYEEIKDRITGHDVYIFGNGPSLTEIATNHHILKDKDFFSVAMSSFQLAADDILRPIGRKLDFACITHPDMILENLGGINDYMRLSPDFHLIVPLYISEMLKESKRTHLIESTRIFWNDIHSNILPHPGEPIHIPAHNTLSSALSSIYILSPRRIFLFGFDGRIYGDSSTARNSLYYKENDTSYLTDRSDESVRRMTGDWLFLDSKIFNDNTPCILRHLRLLFDLPSIPIYNVCPDSAISVFPKIDLANFNRITMGQH